jgi:hypothetical protein
MGQTHIELYRSGNSSVAQLDKVRPKDVDMQVARNGDVWVLALNGKGVSTWDHIDPTWNGKPWRLPAGSLYNDHLLLLWNDSPGHWTWAPAHDMLIHEYVSCLAQVSARFVKV